MTIHGRATGSRNDPQIGASHGVRLAHRRVRGEGSRHRAAPRHGPVRKYGRGPAQIQAVDGSLHVKLPAVLQIRPSGDVCAQHLGGHLL